MAKTKLMSMPEELSINSEGQWCAGDVRIIHPGLVEYLNKNLAYDYELNSYLVKQGEKAVKIEIVDTAAVVSSLEVLAEGFKFLLSNGGSQIKARPQIAYCENSSLYYAKVDFLGRNVWAKILSAGVQALAPLIEKDEQGYFINRSNEISRIRSTNRVELKEI